jgi:hypothetical protein
MKPRSSVRPPTPGRSRWRTTRPSLTTVVALVTLIVLLALSSYPVADQRATPSSPAQGRSTVSSVDTVPLTTPAGRAAGAAAFALNTAQTWVSISPDAPGAGAGAGFAALSSIGQGVFFGGATLSGLENATYQYVEASNQWLFVATATAPSPRSDFEFSSDPASSTAILFGGRVNSTTSRAANDTWVYSFLTKTWTNVSDGVAPLAREDAAFAVGNGIALLYGGWDTNSGGSGEVTYSDTWSLNLSTDVWSRITVAGGISPGSLRGASLLWQPSLQAFVLFGGCYPCSSTLWTFTPSTHTWSTITPSTSTPSPRMEGVWVWDPALAVDELFGGTNGSTEFNDTFLYAPGTSSWTRASTPGAPSPRSSAAADFLNSTGNQTLLLSGGEGAAGPLADTWRLAEVANLTVIVTNATSGTPIANGTVGISRSSYLLTNATGVAIALGLPAEETIVNATDPGFAEATTSTWLSPGENDEIPLPLTPLDPASVDITVVAPGGIDLSGAAVNISFGARLLAGSPHFTNATGVANFSDVPSALGTVSVSHPHYHTNSTRIEFLPGIVTAATIELSPTLVLAIQTIGLLPDGGQATLEGVAVVVADLPAGATGSTGWLNITTNATGVVSIEAGAYGFKNTTVDVDAVFTGVTVVELKLKPGIWPTITVQVIGRSSGSVQELLRYASVNVTSTTTLPIGKYYGNFSTGAKGTVVFSPPPGNFTFSASAPGYVTNSSAPELNGFPAAQLVETIFLTPVGFSELDVLVVSTGPGVPPIPGATVVLNLTGLNLTDGLPYSQRLGESTSVGWANFSGIPVTNVIAVASAPGFYSNSTGVALTHSGGSFQVEVFLTPVPPAGYAGLRILPTNPDALWALALLPAAALVGVLVYLTMLRTPSGSESIRRMGEETPTESSGRSKRP